MFPRSAVVCLLLLLPAMSRAQQEPENLLPAGAQVYLRWDGVDAHRQAYSQTALGKMLQGDSGRFFPTFIVSYATVAAPSTFVQIASVNYTTGAGNGGRAVGRMPWS